MVGSALSEAEPPRPPRPPSRGETRRQEGHEAEGGFGLRPPGSVLGGKNKRGHNGFSSRSDPTPFGFVAFLASWLSLSHTSEGKASGTHPSAQRPAHVLRAQPESSPSAWRPWRPWRLTSESTRPSEKPPAPAQGRPRPNGRSPKPLPLLGDLGGLGGSSPRASWPSCLRVSASEHGPLGTRSLGNTRSPRPVAWFSTCST